ncbi:MULTISPECIES: hypothetical protein [Pseudomonas]|uniref:Immunity protein 22 n=1 Tax=Pseudomonas poae TaxID=200451 RepID=A0ABY0SAF9_9PSED|nr:MULTISPECIES: hypothetical protein [Pseudomonas]KRP41186.1 hypothetical protein TU75_26055 [Pseudomonas poae]CRM23547.1 hypothetical protein [Pseudomonas sp. 24 R 17]SDO91949.1 hypothetical protein SAMN04490208_5423 [Pseudomonas poae]
MRDGCWPFHLFGANFATEAEAKKFVCEQWEPEPPESASEAEYVSWEERNPTWRLAEELGFYMDSDFVELIGTTEDVIAQIRSPSERALFSSKATEFTHFILVGSNAIWGDRRSTSTQVETLVRLPESTATITYLGLFN